MNYLKLTLFSLFTILTINLPAQNVEYDTIFHGRAKFYNTIGFQSKDVTLFWTEGIKIKNGTLDGNGELEIRAKRKKGEYRGEIIGRVKGNFQEGFIHGVADVKKVILLKDGSVRNRYKSGIFEKGFLVNYDKIYESIENYINEVDFKEYFRTSEQKNFRYSIFSINITSAPFCEEAIMGFKASATIKFESKDKEYDFTLTLRKPNFFDPLQYKLSGNNRFTSRIIINRGKKATMDFILKKNFEALTGSEPEKFGTDQYKNTFGYWIKELPDSILDIGREQILQATKKHNEKYDFLTAKDEKLRGAFFCNETHQIFYFEERGKNLLISDLTHKALTRTNDYQWNTVSLTYKPNSKDCDFETIEKDGIITYTKKFIIQEYPKMENNFTAKIKNGKYEYTLRLIK